MHEHKISIRDCEHKELKYCKYDNLAYCVTCGDQWKAGDVMSFPLVINMPLDFRRDSSGTSPFHD